MIYTRYMHCKRDDRDAALIAARYVERERAAFIVFGEGTRASYAAGEKSAISGRMSLRKSWCKFNYGVHARTAILRDSIAFVINKLRFDGMETSVLI